MPDLQRNQDKPQWKKGFWTPKRVARMAILIALSAVGALIKIPSPYGTVALDAAPGYFSAAAFGGVEGGIVAAIGHMFTAATTGFPLGLPIHLLIAAEQAIWAFVFYFLVRKVNLWAGIAAAIVCNGVLASAIMIPIGGIGMFAIILLPLTVGSAINVIVASLAYKTVNNSKMI